MNKLVVFFKTIGMGLANVIPGLSGGTIAVIVNIYDSILDAFANIFTHPIKVIKKYYPIILGIVVGFIVGMLLIDKAYQVAPIPTSMLFAGFVVASVPYLAKKLKGKALKWYHFLFFALGFALIVGMPYLKLIDENAGTLTFTPLTAFLLGFLGIAAAIAMVLPGVSGSMILAATGYYEPVLAGLKSILKQIITYSFEDSFLQTFLLLFIFLVGAILGIVFASKLVKMLLAKFPISTYSFVFGLVSASAIAIVEVLLIDINCGKITSDILSWVFGAITLIVGTAIGFVLSKYSKEDSEGELYMFEKETDKVFDDALTTVKELIAFPSVLKEYDESSDAPFGKSNKEALEYMLNKASKDGFKVLNSDNYAGHIEFGPENGELLGVLGHLDVVPVDGQIWSHDPFDAYVKDGKVYGRGSIDDKGPVVAAYYGLKLIKDANLPVTKRVRLIIGCDEESGSRCLEHYFKKEEMPVMGFSPDAEFPLIYGEKSITTFDVVGKLSNEEIIKEFTCGTRYNIVPANAKMKLSCNLEKEYLAFLAKNNYKGHMDGEYYVAEGLSSHGAVPQNGVNAGFILVEFLNEVAPTPLSRYISKYFTFDPFGSKLGINVEDEYLGKLTENVGFIMVNDGHVKIGVNLRAPKDNFIEFLAKQVNASLESLEGYEYKLIDSSPIHFVDPNSALVQTLMKAYQDVTKDYTNKPFTIGGGTYAKFIDNAVAFGPVMPGSEDVCHIADEYMVLEDFKKAIAIYAQAIYELIK